MSASWLCIPVLSLATLLGPARGGSGVWDESVDGDLSTNPAAPTAVSFALGSNLISGTVTSSAPSDTRDYITFTIPSGQALVALKQMSYVDVPGGGGGNTGYNCINSGSTSLVPGIGNSASFLGGDHIVQFPTGFDMLPVLAGAPSAGTGFTVPLGPGTYCYEIQQTGTQKCGYQLDFVLGTVAPAIPVPGQVALVVGALGVGIWMLRRRRVALVG